MDFIEKRIDQDMDKMFGEESSQLKIFTKLARLKDLYGEDDELNHQIDTLIIKSRKALEIEKACIKCELKCTLDASGNVVEAVDDF